MAVIVKSSDPRALLEAVFNAVRSGCIPNWRCDREGYYELTPYADHGWLFPCLAQTTLVMNVGGYVGVEMDRETYAVYHAEFIHVLLTEFDEMFDAALATAMAIESDVI